MGVIREHTHFKRDGKIYVRYNDTGQTFQRYPKLYKCKVYLHGCDDSTVFELEVTEDEMYLLKEVEILSKLTSSYGCMPIMEIENIK